MGTNSSDVATTVKAQFDNVNGLKPRAKATMISVTIGRVDSITLDPVTRLATVAQSLIRGKTDKLLMLNS